MTTNASLPTWTRWALLGAVAVLVVLGVVYAELDVERHVPPEKMPPAAREFMASNFAGQKAVLSKMEREFFCKEYEVILDGGTKIEFDHKGRWIEVDCKYGSVPQGIIPVRITEYLQAQYPGSIVTEIKRKRSCMEVEIDGRIELTFDKSYNLIGFDD